MQPQLVAANGVLYFRADNGVVGNELWRSDGTADGTYLLKDISPPGATNGNPTRLFAANGFVYFAATDDNSINVEAWRSDGTPAGTAPIGNYYPEGSFINNPRQRLVDGRHERRHSTTPSTTTRTAASCGRPSSPTSPCSARAAR